MNFYKNDKNIIDPLNAGDKPVNMYQLTCPVCKAGFKIAFPREGTENPDTCKCPNCGTFRFDISFWRIDKEKGKVRANHDEIRLTEPEIMGRTSESIYSLMSLYPILPNEKEEDRMKRIAGYIDEECKDLMTADPSKRYMLAQAVLSRNINAANIIPKIFQLYEGSEDKAEFENRLSEINSSMTSPQIIGMLGESTRRADPAIEQFIRDSQPVSDNAVGGMIMGSVQPPILEKTEDKQSGSFVFCRNCGTKCSGKFCPECGTPVEQKQ